MVLFQRTKNEMSLPGPLLVFVTDINSFRSLSGTCVTSASEGREPCVRYQIDKIIDSTSLHWRKVKVTWPTVGPSVPCLRVPSALGETRKNDVNSRMVRGRGTGVPLALNERRKNDVDSRTVRGRGTGVPSTPSEKKRNDFGSRTLSGRTLSYPPIARGRPLGEGVVPIHADS